MKRNSTRKLFLLIGVLTAVSLACALLPGNDNADGIAEVNEPEDGSSEDSGAEDMNEPAEEPRAGDATCVVGTWAVDTTSMADFLAEKLNQGGENFFKVNEVSGAMIMDLSADGVMSLSSEDFTVSVRFDPGIADLAMNMTFVYEASGTAQYAAEDGTLRSWDQDWSVEETSLAFNPSITADGATFTLSINPGVFMQQEGGDSSTDYGCSGDKLTMFVPDGGEVIFIRQ